VIEDDRKRIEGVAMAEVQVDDRSRVHALDHVGDGGVGAGLSEISDISGID